LIYDFGLAISLSVVSGEKLYLDAKDAAKLFLK